MTVRYESGSQDLLSMSEIYDDAEWIPYIINTNC